MRFGNAMTAVLAIGLGACASRGPAPERELFRLATASLAEGATAGRTDAPTAPAPTIATATPASGGASATHAFTTSIRIAKPDGTTLAAPRLTAFAGQRAHIQILNQTAYVMDFDVDYDASPGVVDPVIGTLHEGASIELLVVPAADDGAALALRVETTSARKPFATREIALDAATPVTIQTPHVETVAVVGARRVRLGEETEWARLPAAEGGADLVLLGRVDAVVVEIDAEEIDAEAAPPVTLDDVFASASAKPLARAADRDGPAASRPGRRASPRMEPRPADLRALAAAAAAAAGAPCGELRVTAVRSGRESGSTVRTENLGALSLRTVLAPGVGLSDLLREPYVADLDACIGYAGRFPIDPVIDTAASGLAAVIGDDGALTLQWTALPRFETFETTLAQGPPIRIELPDAATSVRRVTPTPGAVLHPMFRLPGGGTAAVIVEWTPDAK